jgi:hypothetical protein
LWSVRLWQRDLSGRGAVTHGREVCAYFNNDGGDAVRGADALRHLLNR